MTLPDSPEAYEALLQENFAVDRPGAAAVELQLVQVTRKADDDVQRIFRVTFEGPAPLLPQGLYRLRHPRMELVDLLLVPCARTKTGFRYDATFNLLKQMG